MIGSKIAAYIGGGLAAVLALTLAYVIISKNATITALRDSVEQPGIGWRARLSACEADRVTLRSNQASITGAIQEQNTAIDGLTASSAAKYRAGAEARSAAVSASQNAAILAAALGKVEPLADRCLAADALILESVR